MTSYLLFTLAILNNPPDTKTEQPRYWERNRQKCLEKGRKYYDENRAWQQKLADDQNKGSSKEEKYRKREYARNRYWNMSEEDR